MHNSRVPNRFGGMRDSAFFRRDIRDFSSKLGREAGIKITSGSGIFVFSWGWDSGFAKGTGWDTGFQSALISRASESLELAPPFLSRSLLSCDARQTTQKRATTKQNSPA